jgi:hypothetical protein
MVLFVLPAWLESFHGCVGDGRKGGWYSGLQVFEVLRCFRFGLIADHFGIVWGDVHRPFSLSGSTGFLWCCKLGENTPNQIDQVKWFKTFSKHMTANVSLLNVALMLAVQHAEVSPYLAFEYCVMGKGAKN